MRGIAGASPSSGGVGDTGGTAASTRGDARSSLCVLCWPALQACHDPWGMQTHLNGRVHRGPGLQGAQAPPHAPAVSVGGGVRQTVPRRPAQPRARLPGTQLGSVTGVRAQ